MPNTRIRALVLGLAVSFLISSAAFVSANVFAQDEEKKQTQIRWDLTDLYADDEDWEKAFIEISERIEKVAMLRDGFADSPERLADNLDEFYAAVKEFWRLSVYANASRDEDQRVASSQERSAKLSSLATKFGEISSWIDPTLITVGEETLEKYLAEEPRLKPYDHNIRDTIRLAAHSLDEKGEQILASASAITRSPTEIYQMIANADIPWPEIELADGELRKINQSAYTGARSSANRSDRKKVFDAFFSTWKDFEDSLGATLNTEVQANIFQAKARNYKSVLEWQLAQENLPEGVYRQLVKQVNENLPTLHRYFKLRGRILDIQQLHYYDIYPPLVEMETDFSVEASNKIALEVLKPLGKEYNDHLATALSSNWAHVYPQEGKRSGAYMSGSAYDVHPYVLLNHNDDYNALSTYVHEWGHAVHTMLAKRVQPFTKAYYSTFTAEMASTINEILLEEHLIANAQSKEEKLFYLGQALESIRGTFFRQTMFAEFELAIHEAAEAGKPLTGAIFSEMYAELLKKYHDHEGKTLIIDEPYNREWAYIPHFYYDFYVFQYATSISGAAWFAEKFLVGDEQVRDDFLDVLKAGGSDYAYNILRTAGLDMAEPDAYQAIVRRMESIMDRIETLLNE